MAERSEAELVAEARVRITEVDAPAAIAARAGGSILLDVRELNEWNLFRIPGAVHIPIGQLGPDAAVRVPRDHDVIVYCNAGSRSVLAADKLQTMGWTHARALAGGVRAWMQAGGELEE